MKTRRFALVLSVSIHFYPWLKCLFQYPARCAMIAKRLLTSPGSGRRAIAADNNRYRGPARLGTPGITVSRVLAAEFAKRAVIQDTWLRSGRTGHLVPSDATKITLRPASEATAGPGFWLMPHGYEYGHRWLYGWNADGSDELEHETEFLHLPGRRQVVLAFHDCSHT
jgi:hypothetical protein